MSTEYIYVGEKKGEFLCNENQLSLKDLVWKGKVKNLPENLKLKDDGKFEQDNEIYVFKADPDSLAKKEAFAALHWVLEPVCMVVAAYSLAKAIL